jgi:hypothetical protein
MQFLVRMLIEQRLHRRLRLRFPIFELLLKIWELVQAIDIVSPRYLARGDTMIISQITKLFCSKKVILL